MSDPFEALRLAAPATDPDPAFAADLRARVARALDLPEGVTVSDLNLRDDIVLEFWDRPFTDPVATPAVVPYLIVDGAERALDWYVSVFGATRRGQVITMADGRIGHAELELRGSVLYLADQPARGDGGSGVAPASDVSAPDPQAPAAVSLTVEVADVDRSLRVALDQGARLERAAADNPYGRNAVVRDPFGHRWIISAVSSVAPVPSGADADADADADVSGATGTAGGDQRQGDVGYVSLWVPDGQRAAAFYATVLGWTYGAEAKGHARQVEGRDLPHGIFGGRDHSTLFLCFLVDDIEAAVERVGRAGGRAEEPTMEPFGMTSMAVDVEGTPFSIYEAPAGERGRRLEANGSRAGDLAYITMEVQDSVAMRAFYGEVLGWRFNPGHVEDGWGPGDVVPMTGLSGGHEVTRVVPMYRVDDIGRAAARVRAAGGSATDPERQPYGVTSECVDDQGTRFYLGQL
jgi:predicted enzyme related to lactoylglutathione lyase